MRNLILFYVATAMATSACAAADSDKPGSAKQTPLRGSDCVFFSTVYDWQSLDDHNMVIWAPSHRDAYHVYFLTPLVGLNFNMRLAFVDKDRDGRLCGFSRDEVVVPDNGFPQHATISAMKRLDADGIAKLEAQYKVKLTRNGKKQIPKEPDRQSAQ